MGRKIQKSRLRWIRHVERRDESHVRKKVEDLSIEGRRRRRGKPKLRWIDKVVEDLREKRWKKRETANRGLWRGRIKESNADPK